jgi:hypothetical protein
MEYVLLTFFAVLVLFTMAFFLTGWQITGAQSQRQELTLQKSLFILKSFSSSPYINRQGFDEGSMFEDSKLTVLTCDDMKTFLGSGWWAEINITGSKQECNSGTYPECGSWKFCEASGENIVYEVPVNVYRKTKGVVEIATLRVGVQV